MVDIGDMAHANIQRLNEAIYRDCACLSVYTPAMYIFSNIIGVYHRTWKKGLACVTRTMLISILKYLACDDQNNAALQKE